MEYYIRNENIEWQVLQDESVLLNVETGFYFRLNLLGTIVWEMCDGSNAKGEIVNYIANSFNISVERAEKDVNDFLTQMLANDLIKLK